MSATAAPRRRSRAAAVRRRPLLTALVIAALAIAAVGAVAAWRFGPWSNVGVVEHAVPAARGIPAAITATADGTVWFTLEGADTLGVIRDGQVEYLPKGGQRSIEPLGLAVDAAGNVWHTDGAANAIVRRAPDGTVTPFVLSAPGTKLARLTVAPDGAVWFADGIRNGVTRLKDGAFATFEASAFNAGPFGVAIGADGVVWATLQNTHKLLRITPAGEVTELSTPTRNSGPTDIAVGPDGAVWFIEARANKIGRFADGRFAEYDAPAAGAGLIGLTVAPDGAVWFTMLRAHKLARWRDGVFTDYPLPFGARGEARPYSIAADRAGNIWYTDLSGKVGRLPAERARL